MTYKIPDNYELPKLHNEIIRAVFQPERSYKFHYSKTDFSNIDERDLLATINYWVGDIHFIEKNKDLDRVKFVNNKNKNSFYVDNFSTEIVDKFTHLCLIFQDGDNRQLHWSKPILTTHEAGDKMLSHLYCLWYNDNLPLKPLDRPFSRYEVLLRKEKFKQMGWLFEKMGYNDPTKGWPSYGDKSWYEYFQPEEPKTPKALRF